MTELSTVSGTLPLVNFTQAKATASLPNFTQAVNQSFAAFLLVNNTATNYSLVNGQLEFRFNDPSSNFPKRVECLYANTQFLCKVEDERAIDGMIRDLQSFYDSSASFLSETADTVSDFCKVQFQRLNQTYQEYRPYIPFPSKY